MNRFIQLSDGVSYLNKDSIVRVEIGLQTVDKKDVWEIIIYANDMILKSRTNKDGVNNFFTAIWKFETEAEALSFLENELDT